VLPHEPRLLVGQLAGRFTRIAQQKRRTKVKHGAEEICDVELGNDLGRLLPVELVKLRHPRLHALALRDLLERKAMQYALTGKEKMGKGPLVLLLDRSGSMDGKAIRASIAQKFPPYATLSPFQKSVLIRTSLFADSGRMPCLIALLDGILHASYSTEVEKSLRASPLYMDLLFRGGTIGVLYNIIVDFKFLCPLLLPLSLLHNLRKFNDWS
jgi:hypothetical protein